VHAALGNLGQPAALSEPEVERPTAAQIRKSITRDALISFIDGKAYKPLKRHLTKHGLTPQAYCARYGLPNDYPMGAPRYAAQRYELAKAIGLGRFAMKAAAEKPKKAAVEEPKTRGRRRAA
jgi:predicted transcriptional regulator